MKTSPAEYSRILQKLNRGMEILASDIDYEVATTPADVVYTADKMRLLHYRRVIPDKKVHRPPVLVVYATSTAISCWICNQVGVLSKIF